LRGVDEGALISDLRIPGTHESCALYGGSSVQCQSWSLTS
jgi:hypothetical protein